MGKLQKQQHAELLQVVAIGEAVVAEHGAVTPELLHDAIGFCAHGVVFVIDAPGGLAAQGTHSTHGQSQAPGLSALCNEVFLR